ncbi:MAG: ABC transporter permease subunit [Clostridia bacterium]|nr:ABC transporter permease subunit [Clostridia bacterium]
MPRKVKNALAYTGAFVFWIAVWHIAASAANKKLLLKVPLPIDTVKEFFRICDKAVFWKAVGTSVLHILCGFGLAVVLGTVFGVLSGNIKPFKILSMPILHLIRSVPVAAFIVIAWLWIPSAVLPSFISCLMVLPIIWSHVDAGLLAIDNRLVEMARVYRMERKDIILKIKLPMISPYLRTGCITGLGIAWKSGVAAEVICNPGGSIGALLQGAKTAINYERVFAVTLMVVLLSLLLENILKVLWKEQKR